jgi:hypothetical protein
MRNLTFGVVLGLLYLAPAGAGAATAEIDAEALIDRCWAASREELNSDTPLRIGQGVSAVVACLEYEIVLIVEASQECAPYCGTAYNNVGGFELAKRLEDMLRELAAEHNAQQR